MEDWGAVPEPWVRWPWQAPIMLLMGSVCLMSFAGGYAAAAATSSWSTTALVPVTQSAATLRSASAVPHPRSTSKKNSLSQALPSATPGLHAAQRHEDPGIDVGDSHNAPQGPAFGLFGALAGLLLLLGLGIRAMRRAPTQSAITEDRISLLPTPGPLSPSRRTVLSAATLAPAAWAARARAEPPFWQSDNFWDPMVKMEIKSKTPISPEEAKTLINDATETVSRLYFDAYGNGFSKAKWAKATQAALAKDFKYREDIYGELSSMISNANVDRYTYFLRPEEINDMVKFDVSGIGLNLVFKEEFNRRAFQPVSDALGPVAEDDVVLVAVVKDSPAEAAGMRIGDVLAEVDGQPTRGMEPFQVMSLMQSNGTDSPKDINIRYRRGADGSEQSVAIPRPVALKAKEPVSTSLKVEGGTKKGYISLTEFNSKSPGAVKAAVESLDAQGAQEYVLDLRGNPGGLAQDAVQIAGLFLGSDAPVTYTVSNEGELLERMGSGTPPITDKPLVVRVNFATASASEILAAALRDNCRAPLVGTKTFGKAVIQGIYQFSDGSGIKLTIGKYLTPLKRDINQKGIEPDFFILPSREQAQQTIGKVCTDALAAVGTNA
uniref:PDZ domain-containing protein n=1 Tax=Eutreptiella gymnastica TaxID=73025 RepID=A0A7S4GJ77_9EUGL